MIVAARVNRSCCLALKVSFLCRAAGCSKGSFEAWAGSDDLHVHLESVNCQLPRIQLSHLVLVFFSVYVSQILPKDQLGPARGIRTLDDPS